MLKVLYSLKLQRFISIFSIWFRAVRPEFFTASVIPIILGSVIAWHGSGDFNWFYFILTLLGGLFIHAGLDLANDYFDHTSGVDKINQNYNQFSGGSRMIQNDILSAKKVLFGSIICFALGIAIGLFLDYILPGHFILIIGLIGVFLAFFYSAEPLRLGYTSLGEITCGLGFGPIMVLGSYYVQTGRLAWKPLWASFPVGILIALVLYINEFPDYDSDKQGNKRTLVVALGKRKAIRLYPFFLILTYLLIISSVFIGITPYISLISLLTIPLAFQAIRLAMRNFDKIAELLPVNRITIIIHLSTGLLLIGSYLLDKIILR